MAAGEFRTLCAEFVSASSPFCPAFQFSPILQSHKFTHDTIFPPSLHATLPLSLPSRLPAFNATPWMVLFAFCIPSLQLKSLIDGQVVWPERCLPHCCFCFQISPYITFASAVARQGLSWVNLLLNYIKYTKCVIKENTEVIRVNEI